MTDATPQPAEKPSEPVYADRILYCRRCREPFVFTVGEQRFFAEHGFENEPKHCRDCRAIRRHKL